MNTNSILAFAIVAAVGFAGLLAYKSADGWGWFLFIALMLGFVYGDAVK